MQPTGRSMEGGPNRNDARVRGNAQQLVEKYKTLARDAASAGDRILAEYYMQHADHYYRVSSEFRARYEEQRPRDRENDRGSYKESDQELDGEDAGFEENPVEITPQGFAATASVQTFGVDGPTSEVPPSEHVSIASSTPQTASQEEGDVSEDAEPRRRRRGRPRRNADEMAASPPEEATTTDA